MSARCATGVGTLHIAEWRGCGGARGPDSRPRSGRMPGRSRRRSWTKIRATIAVGRCHVCAPRLLTAAGAIDLLFLDESEALTHPYLARCWARRGTELRIQAPGQAKKRAMLGAFDPLP